MTQEYGAAQPIADWVNNYVYKPAQKVLGVVDKIPTPSSNSSQMNWKPQPNAEQQKEIDKNNKTSKSTPAPKYHKGTDYVPKTGPAILKKGEAVLNEKDADNYRATKGKTMAKNSSSSSRAHAVLGGSHKSKSKSGHKPHSMHVKRGKSGGFVVTHHHQMSDDGTMPPDEDHIAPDLQSLHDHIDANMGDQGPAPQAPPPDQSMAAGPGAGAPPAAAAPPAM